MADFLKIINPETDNTLREYRDGSSILEFQRVWRPYEELRLDWNCLLERAAAVQVLVENLDGYRDIRTRMRTVLADSELDCLMGSLGHEMENDEERARELEGQIRAIREERDRDDGVRELQSGKERTIENAADAKAAMNFTGQLRLAQQLLDECQ